MGVGMNRMSLKNFIMVTALLGCLLAAGMLGLYLEQNRQEGAATEVRITPDSGFYGETQEIRVSVPAGARVYYTDNGEKPVEGVSQQYQKPLKLPCNEEESVYGYRFLTVYEDGREPEETVRTYFVGSRIEERYQTMVLNLTGDPDGLFGYENGILVPGKVWDEFWEAHPDAHVGQWVEANYTMRGAEWEREVYIQFFDRDGRELLSQNGGVRVSGDQTRIKNQKSLRLYARKEYDRENEFDYPFFGNLQSEKDGVLGREYKKLTVRSSGNDNGYGYIRTELVGRLAAEAGFPDTISAVPVCVYVNGGYQGIYWLENHYDGQYFENRYGAYPGEFVILEGGDRVKEDSDDEEVQPYVEDYNRTYERFAAMDLTEEQNYRELCAYLDVENYLQYFAIENYVGNSDWPNYNLKVYRYVAPDGEYAAASEENSVFDGRYRFLLYDTDYGFGLLTFNETVGIYAQKPTLERIVSEDTPLFAALMKRRDCLEYFVNYTCDLMNGVMSQSHVAEVVDEMHAARYEELYHMLEETDIMEGSLWEEPEQLHMDTADRNIQIIKDFAGARPETVIQDIQETFGCGEPYTLVVDKGDAFSTVRLNSQYLTDETFEGTYFQDCPVLLEPIMAANEIFEGWVVNGEIRTTESLTLGAGEVKDGRIQVRLLVRGVENPVLEIAAVKAKGHSDYVEIVNRSRQPVSTRGYFLSDSDDLKRYAFPVFTIQPGESVLFFGKDCNAEEGLGQFGMNFNIKSGETVSLSRGENLTDSVEIPDLSSDEGVYIRDFDRDRYRESAGWP